MFNNEVLNPHDIYTTVERQNTKLYILVFQVNHDIWGVPELKLSWRLEKVPFDHIYRSKYKKVTLQKILRLYKAYVRSDTQDEPMVETLEDDASYSLLLDDAVDGYSPVHIPSSSFHIPSPVHIPSSSQIYPRSEMHQLYGDTNLDTSSSDYFPIKLSKAIRYYL